MNNNHLPAFQQTLIITLSYVLNNSGIKCDIIFFAIAYMAIRFADPSTDGFYMTFKNQILYV